MYIKNFKIKEPFVYLTKDVDVDLGKNAPFLLFQDLQVKENNYEKKPNVKSYLELTQAQRWII
jgi:hypothetical protein